MCSGLTIKGVLYISELQKSSGIILARLNCQTKIYDFF
jgi:hypothetical protein